MLVLEIVKHYDGAYLDKNWVSKEIIPYVFIPILVTLFAILVSTITLFIKSKKNAENLTKWIKIALIVCGILLITTLVLIAVYFIRNIDGDGYYTDGYGNLNNLALYLSAGAIIVLTIIASLILGRKDKEDFDSKTLATAGVCVALSFALSFIKLWEMPQGGSITLVSMLPIMVFSYRYGVKKGVLVGLIYGLLQALQDPFIIHPAQFVLDYPVAFAVTGFAGVFKDFNFIKNQSLNFAISASIGAILRFVCHVLSGVFAFGAYALDAGASNLLVYSLAYNSFVFIDLALVIVVGVMLFSSKTFIKELEKKN
jgi:thiamine transporter